MERGKEKDAKLNASEGINRRSFLKGAAFAGVAGGAAMLAGCSPQATSAESGGSEAAASIPEGYMCQYDWLGTPPEVSDIVETIECEIVVVGDGHADTPAALVYKASWPDERVVRGTVGTLPEMAARHGIRKTALVLVGEFLGGAYERSRLYDPGFSHGYREAKP